MAHWHRAFIFLHAAAQAYQETGQEIDTQI